jgi:hypothetical protein
LTRAGLSQPIAIRSPHLVSHVRIRNSGLPVQR